MNTLRLIIIGPGRAGMALALAASSAGHEITAVVGRDTDHAAPAAEAVGAAALGLGDTLPEADLAIIAVRDTSVAEVSEALAATTTSFTWAVHVSGALPVDALAPLSDVDVGVGSFHPLQTLPTAELGAARIAGAGVAITASGPLAQLLEDLAHSLGARPFALTDDVKPLYHAAAAAASNFPIVTMAMASDLFKAAGIGFDVARPLVEAIVANAFEMGPRAALTGPVARGDVATVEAQLAAVTEATPEWLPAFRNLVDELARLTGRREAFEEIVRGS